MRSVGRLFALAPLVAPAGPAPPKPERQCKPSGAVIFEVDQRVDAGHKLVTANSKLFANGTAQSAVFDVDKKLMRTVQRCLDKSELDKVRDDLDGAKWTVSPPPKPCQSYSPRYTIYRLSGAVVFTERACSGTLDE